MENVFVLLNATFLLVAVKEECEIGLKQYQTDSNLCDLDTTLVRQEGLPVGKN